MCRIKYAKTSCVNYNSILGPSKVNKDHVQILLYRKMAMEEVRDVLELDIQMLGDGYENFFLYIRSMVDLCTQYPIMKVCFLTTFIRSP